MRVRRLPRHTVLFLLALTTFVLALVLTTTAHAQVARGRQAIYMNVDDTLTPSFSILTLPQTKVVDYRVVAKEAGRTMFIVRWRINGQLRAVDTLDNIILPKGVAFPDTLPVQPPPEGVCAADTLNANKLIPLCESATNPFKNLVTCNAYQTPTPACVDTVKSAPGWNSPTNPTRCDWRQVSETQVACLPRIALPPSGDTTQAPPTARLAARTSSAPLATARTLAPSCDSILSARGFRTNQSVPPSLQAELQGCEFSSSRPRPVEPRALSPGDAARIAHETNEARKAESEERGKSFNDLVREKKVPLKVLLEHPEIVPVCPDLPMDASNQINPPIAANPAGTPKPKPSKAKCDKPGNGNARRAAPTKAPAAKVAPQKKPTPIKPAVTATTKG